MHSPCSDVHTEVVHFWGNGLLQREQGVKEIHSKVDDGEENHLQSDIGDRRTTHAQTRSEKGETRRPHADEESEDTSECASDYIDEDRGVYERIAARVVVDPEIEHLHQTVDHEENKHNLGLTPCTRDDENHQMDGHDLLRVLDAQHAPDDQSEHIDQTHPAKEGKTVVLGSRKMAIRDLRSHHATNLGVRSNRGVAATIRENDCQYAAATT